MKAQPTTRDQTRAPGLYDEQLQRLQQEKQLLARTKARKPRSAFFAASGE